MSSQAVKALMASSTLGLGSENCDGCLIMIPFCNLVDIDEMSRVVRERKRTYLMIASLKKVADNDPAAVDHHEETAPAGDGAAGRRLEGDEEGGPRAEHTEGAALKL